MNSPTQKKKKEKKPAWKPFMGFLYHFERQIIKNNKWGLASVEVITTCNRTQRLPSGCLSTANCCCNGAERRPRVSSGPSHFLVLVFPVGLGETLRQRNSTLLIKYVDVIIDRVKGLSVFCGLFKGADVLFSYGFIWWNICLLPWGHFRLSSRIGTAFPSMLFLDRNMWGFKNIQVFCCAVY